MFKFTFCHGLDNCQENINMTVVQCYAPTNDALDDKKAEFYDQLQSVVTRQSNKGITLYSWEILMQR